MILAVDGFNLIYKIPELEEYMYAGKLESAMKGLISILSTYRSNSHKKGEIHIFFDGKRRRGDETYEETVSGVRCYYSHDLSADYLIEQFLIQHKAPGEVWCISSDKRIRESARKSKAHSKTSEEFAEDLKKDQSNEGPEKPVGSMSKKEVNYWLNLFSKRDQ